MHFVVVVVDFTHPDCLRDDAEALNMDSGQDCHQERNPKLKTKVVKTIVIAHMKEGSHKALSRCHECSRDIVTGLRDNQTTSYYTDILIGLPSV